MFKTMVGGSLAKDAEVKDAAGKKVITMLVPHKKYKKDGEVTLWLNCTLWRDAGKEGVAQYLKKGTVVYGMADVEARIYTGKDGQPAIAYDVVFSNDFEFKTVGSAEPAQAPASQPLQRQPAQQSPVYQAPRQQPAPKSADIEEDLPF